MASYLITYGTNRLNDSNGYYSMVINVHPSIWLLYNPSHFLEYSEKLSPEDYSSYVKAFEEKKQKEAAAELEKKQKEAAAELEKKQKKSKK